MQGPHPRINWMVFYTPFSMTIDHCATKCYLRCFCQNEFGNNYCSSVYGLEFPEITDFIIGCRVSKCLRKHPNFFPFFRQNLVGWTQIDCDIDLEVESVGAHSSTINMGWNHFWKRIFFLTLFFHNTEGSCLMRLSGPEKKSH